MLPARLANLALLALSASCLTPALAQDASAPAGSSSESAGEPVALAVDVHGTRDPDLLPYRTMLKGLDA